MKKYALAVLLCFALSNCTHAVKQERPLLVSPAGVRMQLPDGLSAADLSSVAVINGEARLDSGLESFWTGPGEAHILNGIPSRVGALSKDSRFFIFDSATGKLLVTISDVQKAQLDRGPASTQITFTHLNGKTTTYNFEK